MSRKEKKAAEFEKKKEALKQAAEDYNRKTPAQKKATRRWGKKSD